VEFDDDAQLDTSQVSDRRGMGAAPIALGGTGIAGVVIYLLFALLGGSSGSSSDPFTQGAGNLSLGQGSGADLSASCQTGADANQRADCRLVAVVNSVQSYWPAQINGYRKAETVLFSNQTNTGCGRATSAVGPFYCPRDQTIYIDLDFFRELQTRFRAKGGPFAEAYIIAHEYGHHVQNLTGTLGRAGNDEGAESNSVRVELQADCYAGAWAANAKSTGLIEQLTPDDIARGLDAAAAVGDDRIQEAATGRVNPERFTHGTAEQRQRWFSRGYESGDPNQCDTFSTARL
jgi:uncharacterized protein